MKLLKIIQNQNKKIQVFFLIITFGIAIVSIYLSGGTKYSYTHIIYVPFFLSSLLFEFWGGIFGALISTIALALIPVDTITHEKQSFINWFIRGIIFVNFGYIMGIISKWIHKEYNEAKENTCYNPILKIGNENLFRMEIDTHIKNKKNFSIVVIYIENLYEIYNSICHSNSNHILKTITLYFKKFLENREIIMFYSDNHYKFLLKEYSYEDTLLWIEEINKEILNQPINIFDFIIFLKIKIGSSIFDGDIHNRDQLIKNAFIAMDYSKNNLKDFYIYRGYMARKLDFTILISEFRRGINNGELYIEYQPKFDLKTDLSHSVEALIRWSSKNRGMISPLDFIPTLEKTNYINELTLWIIDSVIFDIKEWNEIGIDIRVAINLAPRNMQDEKTANRILEIIASNQPYSNQIEFEMTETDLITRWDIFGQMINKFCENNIKFAIDDFGTGYSSLDYLKKIPADYIKIDRTFTKEIVNDFHNREIVSTIIKLSHTFGKKVIAEGVEDFVTAQLLKEMNCDEIQGYYYSKPLKKHELIDFLKLN